MRDPYTSKPLPLTGTRNTRDLGGYPAAGGKTTRYRQFLRSDTLFGLAGADQEALYAYGVRCVIDLRSSVEISRSPSRMEGYRDVAFLNVPLSDHVHDFSGSFPQSMGDMYIALLDKAGAELARVFDEILRFPRECVLFNCTAGKDRTGTIAMLLLKVAGVPDGDIVRDYAASERYARPWREARSELAEQLGLTVPEHIFQADPENMRRALRHLSDGRDGAEGYLRSVGFTRRDVALLQEKLLGE